MDIAKLPHLIFSGNMSTPHVQGIATDGEFMYFSFTTILLKTDLAGNAVGSVNGLTGHLGCIAYSDTDRRVYGSLEYKNDSIGRGILRGLGRDEVNPDAFYIARFDVDRITRMDMSADEVMTVVKLEDVCEDYAWSDGGLHHRHGCSGIDGMTIVPDFGGKRSLFVAYGIYSDVSRDDNDDQVLLRFDFDALDAHFAPLTLGVQTNGIRADERIFVYTGNTNFGIQNLEYDADTNCIYAAVYCGKKPQFPNYPMYCIDLSRPFEENGKHRLPLAERGELHEPTEIRGIRFPHGSTGMISLGGGYWYFSENGSTPDRKQYSNVRLYRRDGDSFSAV
ncbi:MAG: hypothetical protein IJ493_09820 [Clostridia bacterium]|nr:hypothetical protein [Clostridia bacterium]